ncbi:MAG: serine hydrolase [Gemmatimonadaceae bacterium]
MHLRHSFLPLLAAAFPMVLAAQQPAPAPIPTRPMAAVIARGDSLQLPTKWTPVPGDALAHHTAGFATTLCAAVFLTGLDPKDAAANVGFFTGPVEFRGEVKDTVIDRAHQTVRLTLKNGVTRVAKRYGSQGCVALPIGKDSVFFTPSVVKGNFPPAATTPWPMGDVLPKAAWPAGVDSAMVAQAVNEAFGPPEAMTEAFVVTYKGRIIGERYLKGLGIHSPLESWSMGKSVTGTLVARLIQMGVYKLDQPAPIPEWQKAGDPRQAIRIMDIMRMSSGLRIRAPQDPDFDPKLGYPDHLYYYTGTINSYEWAATRPQQWKPNTVGRYRNTDPVLGSYLVRLGAEKLKQDYHAFPTRALFEKLGMRDAIIYTDPYGNFLGQGYEVIAARDWARLGNLYLQDGMWNGERLLPTGYVDYVRTPAPAWLADGRPVYGGGFFWVNRDGGQPLPTTAYAMLGAGGQSCWIVPSHDLVIVRIGKYRGSEPGDAALRKGMSTLMKAVKKS